MSPIVKGSDLQRSETSTTGRDQELDTAMSLSCIQSYCLSAPVVFRVNLINLKAILMYVLHNKKWDAS